MLFRAGLATTLYLIPAVLVATVFHELAHGLVARAFGDPTAERAGRLTLNPIPHIDLIGALSLLIFGFGWAKPVPVDPRYFRRPYRDMVVVALAGPLANVLWAFVLALGAAALVAIDPQVPQAVINALLLAMFLSISLGLFNLLPVPPLDGSHLLSGLWPRGYVWMVRGGSVLLLVLVLTGVVGTVLGPLVTGVAQTMFAWAQAIIP